MYVRRFTPVGTRTRIREYVLCLGDVCEEIDASWDAESKRLCIVSGKGMGVL